MKNILRRSFKKNVSIITALFMLFSLIPVSISKAADVTQKPTVTIGNSIKASKGQQISVPVTINNVPAAGIDGAQFMIKYDPTQLTFTGLDATTSVLPKVDDGTGNVSTGLSCTLPADANVNGAISVLYGDPATPDQPLKNDGTLFLMKFTVSTTATVVSNLTFDTASSVTPFDLIDTSQSDIAANAVDGYVYLNSVAATGVSLSQNTATVKIGSTLGLTATVSPANATDKNVSWKSDNTNVATVDNTGLVTAIAAGTANITATTEDGSFKATCVVTVPVPVTGVKLNKNTTTINRGNSEQLSATVEPNNAADKNVTWKSDKTSVATVDSTGMVTAVAAGTANITATTEDGSFSDSCTVTVTVPVAQITLNENTAIVEVGKTEALIATVLPTDATLKDITWSSGNTAVATVDNTGVVAAVAKGTTTITAASKDGSNVEATCTITVVAAKIPATGVTLSPETLDIYVGAPAAKLVATVTPDTATDKAIIWTSSDAKIATVDINGYVTAVSKGTATITATTHDGSHTANCTVNVKVLPSSVSITNKPTQSLVKGETLSLSATVLPANADDKSVTWTSSDEKVATVDSNGVVTAVGNGTATITVATVYGSKKDTCEIKVIVPVTGVTITPSTDQKLIAGKTLNLTANVAPDDATNKTVTWSSSDTSVATVTSTGVVTGVKAGDTTITATTADGNKAASLKVTVVANEVKLVVPDTVSLNAGDNSFDVTLYNNTDTSKTMYVLVGLYDKTTNAMVNKYITPNAITLDSLKSQVVTVKLTGITKGDYTIKFFVWDNLTAPHPFTMVQPEDITVK